MLIQDLKRKWRPVDYFWAALIIVFCALTAIYSFEVVTAIEQQRDVKKYKPEEFKVFTYAQLQKKFDEYRWPEVSDLWIPVVTAILLGFLEQAIMKAGNDWAYRIQLRTHNPTI